MDIPIEMLQKADKDKYLDGYVLNGDTRKDRLGILHNNKIIGFLTPRLGSGKALDAWRTGTIYISEQHRGKGYGKQAIKEFFKDKPKGVAFVDPDNTPSRRSFEGSGFTLSKMLHKSNGEEYLVYRKGF